MRERDAQTPRPQGLERSWHLGKNHFPSSWPSWSLPAEVETSPAALCPLRVPFWSPHFTEPAFWVAMTLTCPSLHSASSKSHADPGEPQKGHWGKSQAPGLRSQLHLPRAHHPEGKIPACPAPRTNSWHEMQSRAPHPPTQLLETVTMQSEEPW